MQGTFLMHYSSSHRMEQAPSSLRGICSSVATIGYFELKMTGWFTNYDLRISAAISLRCRHRWRMLSIFSFCQG